MKANNKINKRQFTLVELIIVIVVIGILAAMALPKFMGVQRDAKVAAMEQDLEVVEKAVMQYVSSTDDGSYPFKDLNSDKVVNQDDLYYKSGTVPQTILDNLSKVDDDGSEIYELDMDKLKPYIDKIKYPDTEYLYSDKSDTAIDPIGKDDGDGGKHHIAGIEIEKKPETENPTINEKPIVELTTNLEGIEIDTIIKWEYTFTDEDKEPTKISFILNEVEYDSFDKIPTKLESGEYTIKIKMQDSKGLWSDEIVKNFIVTGIHIPKNIPILGDSYTFKINDDGNLYAWGSNARGQLGIGNTIKQTTPQLVTIPNGEKPISIPLGGSHSMAITDKGNLYTWGWNYNGQLGIGNTTTEIYSSPQLVTIPNGEKPIVGDGGYGHSMVITDKGNLYAWGYNAIGQLGLGNTTDKTTPQLVTLPNGEKPVSITCGYNHSMVITDKGNIYAWGSNVRGELGIGNIINQSTPQKVTLPNGEKPISIDSVGYHSMALTDKGNLYTWGWNNYGQLGVGNTTTEKYSTPQLVTIPNGETPVSIVSGLYASMCSTNKGNIYTWGSNSLGQLGIGNTNNQSTPQLVNLPNGETPISIISGKSHFITITNKGNIYGWGSNSSGLLESGGESIKLSPVKVTLP